MNYRISTLIFSILCAIILLSWFAESRDTDHRTLIGKWQDVSSSLGGYRSTLTIRTDGTFTKEQWRGVEKRQFVGTYTFHADGSVCFYVTNVDSAAVEEYHHQLEKIIKERGLTAVNHSGPSPDGLPFRCNYGFDHRNRLTLVGTNAFLYTDVDLKWGTFTLD